MRLWVMTRFAEPLNTVPVGVPALPPGPGTVTSLSASVNRGRPPTSPTYSSEVPPPLAVTQKCPPSPAGRSEMPHALRRAGSRICRPLATSAGSR